MVAYSLIDTRTYKMRTDKMRTDPEYKFLSKLRNEWQMSFEIIHLVSYNL
jgi:hypothetical protein